MSQTLLLIDDDELTRSMLMLLLQQDGWHVVEAENGAAALQMVKEGLEPHVVLADLQMPGICGQDLAVALREACGPHASLLAMTATIKNEVPEYDALLQKPVDAEAVRGVLSGHSQRMAGQADKPALSEATYAKLAASMRPDQIASLYEFALADADARVKKLYMFAEKGQDAELRAQAHALKGSAAMIGALRLQSLASTLEGVGTSLDTRAAIEEIVEAIARLRSILAERSRSS
ncbi:MAG: response regulator [Acidobacteria bacterium]|nr:response regulator [Acidobacteriota bacterium]